MDDGKDECSEEVCQKAVDGEVYEQPVSECQHADVNKKAENACGKNNQGEGKELDDGLYDAVDDADDGTGKQQSDKGSFPDNSLRPKDALTEFDGKQQSDRIRDNNKQEMHWFQRIASTYVGQENPRQFAGGS